MPFSSAILWATQDSGRLPTSNKYGKNDLQQLQCKGLDFPVFTSPTCEGRQPFKLNHTSYLAKLEVQARKRLRLARLGKFQAPLGVLVNASRTTVTPGPTSNLPPPKRPLEVVGPPFVCWFRKHNFSSKGLTSSKKQPCTIWRWLVDFQG